MPRVALVSLLLLFASPALAQQEPPIMTLVPASPPAHLRLEVTVDLHLAPPVVAGPSANVPQSARAARPERRDRTWLRAIIAGAVTFVAGYAIPATGSGLDLSATNGSVRFIPVVGSFLLAGETTDAPWRIGYVLTGIAQLAGLATLIGGIATIPVADDGVTAALEVGPTGLQLRGTF